MTKVVSLLSRLTLVLLGLGSGVAQANPDKPVRHDQDASAEGRANPEHPAWGPVGDFHHWGESEWGYFVSDDAFVIRSYAHDLVDAGVDVIFFDVTNADTYHNVYKAWPRLDHSPQKYGWVEEGAAEQMPVAVAQHATSNINIGRFRGARPQEKATRHYRIDLQRPNILFIFTEDQSPHMSFLGTEGLDTPNMDRIARQGVYFHLAFVQYPVCSPSKGNLFTGLAAATHGIRANTINIFRPAGAMAESDRRHPLYDRLRIADQYPTLIEMLREQGYYLGVTHKLHVLPNEKFPYHEWVWGPTKDDLKRFIQEATKRDQPFFLFYNIPQPHRPFPDSDQRSISVDPNEVSLPPLLPDDAVSRQDWAEYLANIEVADRNIGLGLEALEETGMTDKTIIFFAGDHGPAYHRGKMSLYDFGVRVPLAVAGPGIPSGVETNELISFLDLMPTILDMVGGPKPELAHGHSVLPFLRGDGETTGRNYVFAEIQHQAQTRDDGMQERMVFDGRYRLIYREGRDKPRTVNADMREWPRWRNRVYDHIVDNREQYPEAYRLLAQTDNSRLEGPELPRYELYDWTNDPWDLENLADDPEHRETLDRLRRVLHDWLVDIDDAYVDLEKLQNDLEE